MKGPLDYVDTFGFIPERIDISWRGGEIRTLDQFEEALSWFDDRLHPDGHLYPPTVRTYRGCTEDDSEPVPKSDRPALLHGLPATHELRLAGISPEKESARNGLAGFVIHFLGFLYGARCQFEDWWIDLRVPRRPHVDTTGLSPRQAGICIEKAVSTWGRLAPRDRTVFTNALYLFNRAPGYEWPWERFMSEYVAWDAAWSVGVKLCGLPGRVRHKDRFTLARDRFGLWYDKDVCDGIVDFRNALFHDALWAGKMPGAAAGEAAFRAPHNLHKITRRFVFALMGFTGDYVESRWSRLVTRFLDLHQLKRPD